MAVSARRDAARIGELRAVDVLVALLALRGGCLEVHVHHSRFHVGWLMAVNAGRTAVRSQQGKTGPGMIELLQVFPGDGGMAGFASGACSIGAPLLDAILELAFMRIAVADGARAVLKAV